MPLKIRALSQSDQDLWLELWKGYLAFYETEISQEQTALTWSRLLDPSFEMHALVAESSEQVVGFAHYSFTYSSWGSGPNLFLEDLFVAQAARGQGVGKALIEALDKPARAKGSEKIYWETHKDNLVAQSLYTGVSARSEFVTYIRPVA